MVRVCSFDKHSYIAYFAQLRLQLHISTVKVPTSATSGTIRGFPVFQAIGPFRWMCHWKPRPVVVEDDDLFPSNRFKDEIENNDFEGVSLLECMALSQ